MKVFIRGATAKEDFHRRLIFRFLNSLFKRLVLMSVEKTGNANQNFPEPEVVSCDITLCVFGSKLKR